MTKISIIVILVLAVCVGFIALPDPTVEWHYFRDTFQKVFINSDFRLAALETYVDPPPASNEQNIPWWIRIHPRRYFSESWQKDFVGLSSGTDLYTFRKQNVDFHCHVYSIRQRTCSIKIVTSAAGEDNVEELRMLIKARYPTLPISIKIQ